MLERGDKIGDYTLVKFLGRGQFGEVWLAEKQLQFSKRKFQHALKFLFNLGDEINLKSAGAEIDTWIEASGHPNVMSVLDMLIHNDHIIIASEYAEGGSLKAWLSQSDGKAPSYEKALEIMTGVLSGIEHLHSRNVVHRDLKPDNILLQGNFPRITDFGISRIVSAGSMSTVAMGSPFYMSPESFDGSKSTQTDIWSAGVILYEMLTGEHPYRSETIYGLVSAIRQAEPKPLPEHIPAELRNIVETALQKDLTRRYQTAKEMRAAVEMEIYNLKIGSKSLAGTDDFSNTPTVVNPAVTLVNEYFDNSLKAEPEPPPPAVPPVDPGKAMTEIYNIEQLLNDDSIAANQKPQYPDPPLVADPATEISPMVDAGSNRPRSAVEKFMEAVEQEFQTSAAGDSSPTRIPLAVPPMGDASGRRFEDSQFSQTKRPLMLIGGIGSAVVVGAILSVIAIVALVFVSRSIFTKVPAVVADKSATATAKTETPPPAPAPPSGMVYVEGGEFIMGRDDGEIPEERPSHTVSVQPFFMDIYEVTNEEYAQFVTETGHHAPQGWKANSYQVGEAKYPVVGVNWYDASDFAKWKGMRLPTEVEWEFAARGKDGRLYPWGNDWRPKLANVDGASGSFAEVGKFKGESPYGIFDMLGNAWEWTASDFKAYPKGNLSPIFADKTNLKTIRGNDFSATRNYATATYRLGWPSSGGQTYNRLGFRCAKDVSE